MAVGGSGGAGGSSPGDIRAGGAYYEIAGRDRVSVVVEKIQAKVKGLSGAMKGIGASAFGGGLLGGIVGGSLTEIGKRLGDSLADAAFGLNRMNAELAVTERILARYEKSMERATKVTADWRGAMTDPGAKVDSLSTDIDKLRAESNAFYKDWLKAKADYDALTDKTPGGFLRFMMGKDEDVKKAALDKANKLSATITKINDKIRTLQDERTGLLDPTKSPAAVGALNRELEKTRDELDLLEATDVEKALFPFEKMGFAADQLAEFRKELELLSQAKHDLKNLPNAATPIFGGILGAATMASAKVGEMLKKFEGAKGISGGAGAMQRLGYGDVAMKRQETLLQKIVDHTEPSRFAREISKAMEMR